MRVGSALSDRVQWAGEGGTHETDATVHPIGLSIAVLHTRFLLLLLLFLCATQVASGIRAHVNSALH